MILVCFAFIFGIILSKLFILKPFQIALIRLPHKVKFSKYIQPVTLPKVCKSTEGIDTLVMGNGATSDSTSVSPELSFAFLQTLSVSECQNSFPGMSKRKSIICARNAVNDQSICKGDSGGPLVTRSDGILIGVSSFVHKGKNEMNEIHDLNYHSINF